MRRKHYVIGGVALVSAIAAAAVVLPKLRGADDMGGMAYLPSGMLSAFHAPSVGMPPAEVDMPAIEQPQAVPQPEVREVAEVPASTPIDEPIVVAGVETAPIEEPVLQSNGPISTPFVWQGSGGSGQSWRGTGGRAAALNNGPSAPSGGSGGGGGGGGASGGTSPAPQGPVMTNSPNIPSAPKAPTLVSGPGKDDKNGLIDAGGAAAIETPTDYNGGSGGNGGNGGNGLMTGPGQYASYQAPPSNNNESNNNENNYNEEQTAPITVDEPGTLSLLLMGAMGLVLARRAKRRTA